MTSRGGLDFQAEPQLALRVIIIHLRVLPPQPLPSALLSFPRAVAANSAVPSCPQALVTKGRFRIFFYHAHDHHRDAPYRGYYFLLPDLLPSVGLAGRNAADCDQSLKESKKKGKTLYGHRDKALWGRREGTHRSAAPELESSPVPKACPACGPLRVFRMTFVYPFCERTAAGEFRKAESPNPGRGPLQLALRHARPGCACPRPARCPGNPSCFTSLPSGADAIGGR
ncbi:PREDICTED: uncharacterized protein LOC109379506 [Hipposideros armiger]|uniref:Uncharacterized protein LOC109379506 n=1 Tax=Hipposideros armiger TaxID=186990 RepID=A0A8B7QUY9_HIPAR|nr:PREDICTED: uncharacterized protein LOC109379506 [Hipposideros armiger]